MLAAAVASLAAALIQGVAIGRRLRTRIAAGVRAYDFRTWIATSLPISIAGTFYFLLSYVDILVLQAYRPATDVAVYFAAQKLLALVAFVHFSIAATVAHRFSEMRAAGQQEQLVRFYARARQWTLWPSLAGVVFLMTFGWPLLWLFGPEFVSGYALLAILAAGLLARAAVGPAERLLNMFGRQNVCALVYLAAFACNLAGCFLLVPAFGAAGAAASTSAALLVESAALYALARRHLRRPRAAAAPA
jgi:O-antigen/teichoic acid export membrane protein